MKILTSIICSLIVVIPLEIIFQKKRISRDSTYVIRRYLNSGSMHLRVAWSHIILKGRMIKCSY